MFNVEKIEAIKGPASSLFSNASPGGIINIVTKQPLTTRRYELSASYGTYNLNALPIRWTRHNENDFSKIRGLTAKLRFSHQFSSQLSLHAMARSVHSYQEQQDITSGFGELFIAGVDSLMNRSYQYFKQKPLFSF